MFTMTCLCGPQNLSGSLISLVYQLPVTKKFKETATENRRGTEDHRGMIVFRIYRRSTRLRSSVTARALFHCIDMKELGNTSVVLYAFSAALCGRFFVRRLFAKNTLTKIYMQCRI